MAMPRRGRGLGSSPAEMPGQPRHLGSGRGRAAGGGRRRHGLGLRVEAPSGICAAGLHRLDHQAGVLKSRPCSPPSCLSGRPLVLCEDVVARAARWQVSHHEPWRRRRYSCCRSSGAMSLCGLPASSVSCRFLLKRSVSFRRNHAADRRCPGSASFVRTCASSSSICACSSSSQARRSWVRPC